MGEDGLDRGYLLDSAQVCLQERANQEADFLGRDIGRGLRHNPGTERRTSMPLLAA